MIQKTDLILKQIKRLEEFKDRTIAECEREERAGQDREAGLRRRWCRELESGGNLRYITGKEDQGWHKSCCELVRSRFIASDFIVSTIPDTVTVCYIVIITYCYHNSNYYLITCTCIYINFNHASVFLYQYQLHGVIIIDNIRSALHVYQTILSNVETTCTRAIYKF